MHAKLVDRGALSCTGHTADAYAQRLATIGKTLLDNLLRLLLVVGIDTLYQCYGLTKHRNVAFKDAFNHLIDGVFVALIASALQIRINCRRLLYSGINRKPLILTAVFWMFHNDIISL